MTSDEGGLKTAFVSGTNLKDIRAWMTKHFLQLYSDKNDIITL